MCLALARWVDEDIIWLPAGQRSPGHSYHPVPGGGQAEQLQLPRRTELAGFCSMPPQLLAQKDMSILSCCETAAVGSCHLQRLLSAKLSRVPTF